MSSSSSLKALPARVVPLPGESLVSLIRRTAAVMGYKGPHELRSLMADDGKVQTNLNPLGQLQISPAKRATIFICYHPEIG